MNFTFRSAPHAICETGALARLGTLMAGLGATRVQLVCDAGITALGFAETAVAALEGAGLQARVFDAVTADPPEETVLAAVAAARDWGADGVVGLGGGSSLDTAKIVALLAQGDETLHEVYGTDRARGTRLPLIQVPTTAGTGSEVTWVSVITDPDHIKRVVYAPQLLPDVALLDPALTMGLPPKVTAATGLDAMVHAIEAYTSRTRKNPLADGLALTALKLLGQNIMTAVTDGGNVAAREAMLQGSMIAGMAFANASVAAIHGLAYPLGGRFHVPHGHANALVMAPVIRFNLPAAEELYAELAPALMPGRSFASRSAAAEAFVARIEELVPETGLETRLRDMGVGEADLGPMADEVFTELHRLIDTNPRDMSAEEIRGLYAQVL